ncbi:MAG TPA: molybdenum ABC transporter substrate-binding protein, partial [Kamptonema sp.]|nr:molybdenum ABC transporter substrate-binding protein [Kamptonema sp.]
MKRKHPKFALVLAGNAVLSTLLLSVGVAFGAPASPNAPEATSTTIPSKERLEIEKLRSQNRILERTQAENVRSFSRTTTLFNVVLVAMAVLLATAIAALLLLRRAVMREIADMARSQLNELKGLDLKIAEANQTVQKLLEKAQDIAEDLEQEQLNFQEEIDVKKEKTSNLFSEVLGDVREQTNASLLNLKKSETEFAARLVEIESNIQKQGGLILENLEKLSLEFAP